MGRRRRIGVVSGSRADYGLLRFVLQDLQADPAVDLQLFLTGAHLRGDRTWSLEALRQDGLLVTDEVPLGEHADSGAGCAEATGRSLVGFARALDCHRPDILVVLGDRFEILGAAQAALFGRIPVAHIHGGERTEGAWDEAIRHGVSKLAALHFVAHEEFAGRLLQMGEHRDRVIVTGAPGLDFVTRSPIPTREALASRVHPDLATRPFVVLTCHATTLRQNHPVAEAEAIVGALEGYPDLGVLLTGTNLDAGGDGIRAVFQAASLRHPDRWWPVPDLGSSFYWSAMKHAVVVLGNSSSGLIEAPAVGTPTINVGDRQRGRLRGSSVIDVPADPAAILEALCETRDPARRRGLAPSASPYGDGRASRRIVGHLRTRPLAGLLEKAFVDVPIPVGS